MDGDDLCTYGDDLCAYGDDLCAYGGDLCEADNGKLHVRAVASTLKWYSKGRVQTTPNVSRPKITSFPSLAAVLARVLVAAYILDPQLTKLHVAVTK